LLGRDILPGMMDLIPMSLLSGSHADVCLSRQRSSKRAPYLLHLTNRGLPNDSIANMVRRPDSWIVGTLDNRTVRLESDKRTAGRNVAP
jgi:hypothetical protein